MFYIILSFLERDHFLIILKVNLTMIFQIEISRCTQIWTTLESSDDDSCGGNSSSKDDPDSLSDDGDIFSEDDPV